MPIACLSLPISWLLLTDNWTIVVDTSTRWWCERKDPTAHVYTVYNQHDGYPQALFINLEIVTSNINLPR